MVLAAVGAEKAAHLLGRWWSAEYRARLGAAAKGRIKSVEHRAKLSERAAQKGKKRTAEQNA